MKLHEIHRIAVFLNPAMKQLVPLFKDAEATAIRNRVKELLQEFSPQPEDTPEKNAANGGDLCEFEQFADAGDVLAHDEVATYMGYNAPPQGQNVLDFWRAQQKCLPKLSSLARRILSVQASSASSERLFSNAKNIFDEKRSRLGSQKLDDLLFVMWNRHTEISGDVEIIDSD